LRAVSGADGGLDEGPLGFVESPANGRAKIDRIRRRSPQPRLVAAIAGTKVEDVQSVARAKRELHVDATQIARQASVFMLRIDDVNLDAAAERSHQERREQVCLTRT
jgi:hypothetical protein